MFVAPPSATRVLRTISVMGFTLIELLVVAVIIGFLAATAIPKFSNTREKAYVASMKSDLRNLATSQESYFSENVTYASSLEALRVFETEGVTIAVGHVRDSGWSAMATHEASEEICTINIRSNQVAPLGPDGEVFCSPDNPGFRQYAAVKPENEVDSLLLSLPFAGVAFTVPELDWGIGQTKRVALVLDPSVGDPFITDTLVITQPIRDSLVATLIELSNEFDSESIDTRPVRYSPRMTARLRGAGFEISPSAPVTHLIGETSARPWEWDVTPVAGGKQRLELLLDAELPLRVGPSPWEVRVLNVQFNVRVSWPREVLAFVADHLEFFWGLMVPLVIYAVNLGKKKLGPRGQDSEGSGAQSPG